MYPMPERQQTEPKLAQDILCTLDSFENWEILLHFLHEIKGTHFLEIGASKSSISAGLRKYAYEAFAIDPAYGYPREHDRKVNHWIRQIARENREWANKLKRARQKFKMDRRENPGFYIPAISTHLPFKSASMDLILTEHCVGTIIAVNYKDLKQSVSEIIRVLKPSGTVIIYPFDNFEFLIEDKQIEAALLEKNQQQLLDEPMLRRHNFSIQDTEAPESLKPLTSVRKTLIIRKIKDEAI